MHSSSKLQLLSTSRRCYISLRWWFEWNQVRNCSTMKLFVLSITIAAALGTLHTESPEWVQFKAKYGKVYPDESEETHRLGIYMKNKDLVDQHNAAGQTTFRMGLNRYADMSKEEIIRSRIGITDKALSVNSSETVKTTAVTAIPTSFDWRTQGAVTPVKDQGFLCESSWAFSATGALESQNWRETGKLVSLSEQNLLDCSFKYETYGCDGGLPYNAFRYVAANGGIDTESSYPYKAQTSTCKYNPANKGATAVGVAIMLSISETALAEAVIFRGPMSVLIDASHDSFIFYKSGVYYEPRCQPLYPSHAALVVGYGTTGTGGDYWIVKNSWGTGWGEEGYILMARNKNNNCGIASDVSYPVV